MGQNIMDNKIEMHIKKEPMYRTDKNQNITYVI